MSSGASEFSVAFIAIIKCLASIVADKTCYSFAVIIHGDQRLFFCSEDFTVAIITDKTLGSMHPSVKDYFPLPCSAIRQDLVTGSKRSSADTDRYKEQYAHYYVSHGYLQITVCWAR